MTTGITRREALLGIASLGVAQGTIGTAGATGHTLEYRGQGIRALSMEGRMTVCNMSIEGGARCGEIADLDQAQPPEGAPEPRHPAGEGRNQQSTKWQ